MSTKLIVVIISQYMWVKSLWCIALNWHSPVCQLHLNKTGAEGENLHESESNWITDLKDWEKKKPFNLEFYRLYLETLSGNQEQKLSPTDHHHKKY